VTLDPNVVAIQSADYYITGELDDVHGRTTLHGAQDGSTIGQDWIRRDEIPAASLVWAKCGIDAISHIKETVSVSSTAAAMGTSPGQDYEADPNTGDAVYDAVTGGQLFGFDDASGNEFFADPATHPVGTKVLVPALPAFPGAQGYINQDSTDVKVSVVYHFVWKHC
jgi:hypothetical protein